MKKIFIIFLLTATIALQGCGKRNSLTSGSPEDQSTENNSEESVSTAETDISLNDALSPTPSFSISDPDNSEKSYTEIVDENGIVSDMCDIGTDTKFLQFNNCDELYSKLPMYAFNILRDSTSAYLEQSGLEDATVFTYVNDSLEITETNVSFICSIEEYPEYELYFDYSIDGAYYDYALLIR